jgi:hypothetical protein
VNITLQSYTDRVDFAVVACGDHVDEIGTLVEHMHAELELLQELASSSESPPDGTAGLPSEPRGPGQRSASPPAPAGGPHTGAW